MTEHQNKTRVTLWFSPDTLRRCDSATILSGSKSRSDFVERAANFYTGYLSAEDHTDFFAKSISEMVSGILSGTENRLARLQFKEAVELAKLTHILASMGEVDDETLRRLHIKCVDEVKRINGVIKFDEAMRYQHSD